MRARPSAASRRPSEGLTKLPNVEHSEASPGWNRETWKFRIDARQPTLSFDSLAQIVAPHALPSSRPPGTHRPDSVSPECQNSYSGGVGLGPRDGPLGKVAMLKLVS